MKKRIFTAALAIVIVLILLLTSVSSVMAARPDNNPGKGAPKLDKIVFVHYPKGQAAKGGIPGAPEIKPGGGGKVWYKYQGIHWEDSALPVSYVISADFSTEYSDAVRASFQVWEDDPESYIDFGEVYPFFTGLPSSLIGDGSTNERNEVGYAPLNDIYPNAIAVTMIWYDSAGIIYEVDMAMNSQLPWSQTALPEGADPDDYTGDMDSYDFQNIATHEVGHWLLLGDLYAPPSSEQTMHGYGSLGELKKRSLESGDIAGLREAYPGATAP
ncbi:hypothetical protein ACFLYQ_06600 [Chloroflexota bacterium]